MKLTKIKRSYKGKSVNYDKPKYKLLENAKKKIERRHSRGIEKMCCDIIPWKMYVSWH